MTRLSRILNYCKRSTFRRQLAALVSLGVLLVSLFSALATSWEGSRMLHANSMQDGLRISQNLAQQSRLALAFGSVENVSEAVAATSAFPDVARIEIRHADGSLLLENGNRLVAGSDRELFPKTDPNAYVETETDDGWRFVAPVWSNAGPSSPFEASERKDELLGFVRIDLNKTTLKALVREVFIVNFSVGIALSVLLVLALRMLAHRVTRPLSDLSETMARAELGEQGLRAKLSGPRDLADMAHAFNSMMEALEQREHELREARDSALRFAKLKADFAATVSHEIRTPLNGIIGTLDMLKGTKLAKDQLELLGLSWESSQYLLELINNILDFSRLEAERMEIDAADFRLDKLLDGIAAMLGPQAEGKGIALKIAIAPAVPRVLNGDPSRIRQVLINLVGNAIKFTESGAVTIAVAPDADGQRFRFAVTDTGIGIPGEFQATIFDSFTQADTSTTRRYGGSGLGLAISKKIIHLLGGEIGVDSTPGKGTCFWFALPLATGHLLVDDSLPAEARPEARFDARILIAEDNKTNQVVAAGMLRRLGCTCGIARNGVEAVKAWREEEWDLILMDCAMPEMDGYQATASIRNLETGSDRRIPIIAMTANTQPADVERCLAVGMNDHLSKPLTLDTLAAHLELWLGSRVAPLAARSGSDFAEGTGNTPVDAQVLEMLEEMLGASLGEAIRPFLEDMPCYLGELESAIGRRNAGTLRRVAHVIKGAASNLGANSLSAIARELELRGDAGSFDETAQLLEQMKGEFASVEPALRTKLAELDPLPVAEPQDNSPLILVVDDDRSTRSALRHSLNRNGFRVAEAGDGLAAIGWLEDNTADAILMDALMPEMDGFSACARIKQLPHSKDIPVLMITALEDRRSIERAFEVGASDFIPKPIHLPVVNQRVRRIVEATRAERHVRQLAYNDTLTGLPNRLLFIERLEHAMERATPLGGQLAILFLDLDRFKYINDTFGHEIGDLLLAAMAERLKGCVRADDCIARLGGDDFTILLSDLHSPGVAASVAQNICRTVSAPMTVSGQEMVLTASIGISVFPADGKDASSLLRHAETAMYRAKQRNADFCYYEPAMESAISDRLRMENDLRRALERNEFTVFYQPVINAASGEMSGVEALVRWLHPERGMIAPTSFIPVAEETGLILALGEWVLRTACVQTKAWLDAGMKGLHVAVNLSARQLEQPNLHDIVVAALHDSGLPPSALVLEITESVLMKHGEDCIEILRNLRRTGIRLAIDDFGTGYSSLSYLKHLPATTLKIDRSFIQDVPDDQDTTAIVTGIMALAHSLRMEVVAEGVETLAQQEKLTELKCDYLQGYLFSKPVPAEVIETQLLNSRRKSRLKNKAH